MSRLCPVVRARTIAFLVVIPLILSATVACAAYRINRPIAFGDEPILQTYLYGEGGVGCKCIFTLPLGPTA